MLSKNKKKILRNNILKLILRDSKNLFNIENSLGHLKPLRNDNQVKVSRFLTNRSIKELYSLNNFSLTKFKFPLRINTFEHLNQLNSYTVNLEKTTSLLNIVLTVSNKNILKGKDILLLKYSNDLQVLTKLKLTIFPIINILKLLNLKIKKTSF